MLTAQLKEQGFGIGMWDVGSTSSSRNKEYNFVKLNAKHFFFISKKNKYYRKKNLRSTQGVDNKKAKNNTTKNLPTSQPCEEIYDRVCVSVAKQVSPNP